jgi:nucleotide-binding universal stress UspA family protein
VRELLELAHTADRIVLQRREHARLSHALTGSVSAGVAGLATVPVASVPELWSRHGRTTRLVAGVDGTGPGNPMVEWAFGEAALLDAQLALVHSWFMPSIYEEAFIGPGAVNLSREATRLQIEQLLRVCRSAFPSVDVRLDVTHAQPVDALVGASRHADLLLVGRRRSRGMVHLGRLARSVLRRSECPVEVIPLEPVDVGPPWTTRGSAAESETSALTTRNPVRTTRMGANRE